MVAYQNMLPYRLCYSNPASDFYSATWKFWTESQPNHLGFVSAYADGYPPNSVSYLWDTTLGCMSYGSTKWQEWILGEKEGLEHIKFA